MKKSILAALALALAAPSMIQGQDAATVDALKNELRELRQRTEQLEEKLKKLETAPPPAPSPVATNAPPTARAWSPANPISLGKAGNSYLNVSVDGLFAAGGSTASDAELGALQPGGHDPVRRGFTVQGIETILEGAIDPYLRGQANLLFQLDQNNETVLELEEAWLETTSLPANLKLRAGQVLTDFGRLNGTHPHAWNFVDSPLVNARLLGPDGLRNPGARLSWLTPTPFYSELSLGIQDSAGETAASFRSDHEGEAYLGRVHPGNGVRGPGDLLLTSRYFMSFDLTREQTLLLGASGAFGPNGSGRHEDTQIYGLDLFWKWKPSNHHYGFPFVTWQSEVMLRHYQAGAFSEDFDGDGAIDLDVDGDGAIDAVPKELLKDWGFYTQVAYGFRKGWVSALRLDFVDRLHAGRYEAVFGDDPERTQRWRLSPSLTWYPSEFSKIRLQYNLDERKGLGVDHSVWLQFEFLLGSHGSHQF